MIFSQVSALSLKPDEIAPPTYEAMGEALGVVEGDLDSAQCGGWDLGDSVSEFVGTGKIAAVRGLPGREGKPLDWPDLGMGKREEGDDPADLADAEEPESGKIVLVDIEDDRYIFPDDGATACGFTSACRPFPWPGKEEKKGIPRGEEVEERFKPEFYANNEYMHPCERPLGGIRPDDNPTDHSPNVRGLWERVEGENMSFSFEEHAKIRDAFVDYSCGGGDAVESRGTRFCADLKKTGVVPERTTGVNGELLAKDADGNPLLEAPGPDGGLCQKLNEDWIYILWEKIDEDANTVEYRRGECMDHERVADELRPFQGRERDPENPEFFPAREGPVRYCCTDAPVGSEMKNCIGCFGESCRFGPKVKMFAEADWECDLDDEECLTDKQTSENRYLSYFRHYLGETYRDSIALFGTRDGGVLGFSDRDDVEGDAPPASVACFGIWDPENEFDPKEYFSSPQHYRCVMNIFAKNDPWDEVVNSRLGAGSVDSEIPDLPLAITAQTPWWSRLASAAFSLLQEKTEEGSNSSSPNRLSTKSNVLTQALLNLDTAEQKASIQTSEGDALSPSAGLRTFDETVADVNPERSFVEWWQEQQNAANILFTAPTVHLLLPPQWSVSVDPLHPLATGKVRDTASGALRTDPQLRPIDVQLQMRDDLLGDVIDYLTSTSLLPLKEERIPIMIPEGSPSEFRALAESWCDWYRYTAKSKTCDGAPAPVKERMEKLREYANRIDDFRSLRAQTMQLSAKALEMQVGMQKKLQEWIRLYSEPIANVNASWAALNDLKGSWEEAQTTYREFHDRINFPWCRNDRFTTPIYSLLDPWWPGEMTAERSFSTDAFPRIEAVPHQDIVMDLSSLVVTNTSMRLPVLDPVLVALDPEALWPPSEQQKGAPGDLNKLPPLPNLDDIPELGTFEDLPVEIENPPALDESQFPVLDAGGAGGSIGQMQELLKGMSKAYDDFWSSRFMFRPKEIKDGKVDQEKGTESAARYDEDCIWPGENFPENSNPKQVLDKGMKDLYDPPEGFTEHTLRLKSQSRCLHMEYDLYERLARVVVRPAVLLLDDFFSIGPKRLRTERAIQCPTDDWVCEHLNPVFSRPRRGWQVLGTAETEREQQDILRSRLTDEMILKPAADPAVPALPLAVPRADVLPSVAAPPEIPLLDTSRP